MKIKFKKMNALKKKQNQNYTKTNKQINKNLTLKNCNCKSRLIVLRKKIEIRNEKSCENYQPSNRLFVY